MVTVITKLLGTCNRGGAHIALYQSGQKNSSHFKEPVGVLPRAQQAAIGPCSKPEESNLDSPIIRL